jgi:hypothetical protein
VFDVLSGRAARGIVWKNVSFSVSQVAPSRRVNGTAVPSRESRSMSDVTAQFFLVGAFLIGLPLSLLVRQHEADCAHLIAGHAHGFFPGCGLGEQRALDAAFGENIVGVLLAKQIPAFMPGHDLVGTRRHVGELEISALIRHRE